MASSQTRKVLTVAFILMLISQPSQSQDNSGLIRTASGLPDFSGIWQAMGTAHWNLETHGSSAGPFYQLGALGAIPGGMGVVNGETIPYRSETLRQKLQNQENWLGLDPVVKCFMPGIPRANYMPYPFQILQTPQHLLFAYQFASASRIVYIDQPDFAAPIPGWMGHNLARWDGDTLVIEVTDQVPDTWFDSAGNYHSENLKVTERFTPAGRNLILYEATIEDPEIFTRPWKIEMPLYRRLEKNAQLVEFKCMEYSEEILYGHLRSIPADNN